MTDNTKKNTWFCSDHHFWHENIFKYCPTTRPFKSVDEMNDAIVEKHNQVVKPGDDVYMLGDVAFVKHVNDIVNILRKMNGNKHLIFGNHDRLIRDNPELFRDVFVWMKDYHELKIKGGKPIVMMHYPIEMWSRGHYGSIHIHGHSHGTIQDKNADIRRVDVGVDCNNLWPFLVDHVIADCKMIPIKNDFKNISKVNGSL